MKIDRIEVYGYELSYRYGKYVMSGNQVINSIPSTVVRILTDSGIEGWGEVCPCLLYTSPSPRDRQKSRMPSSA